MVIDKSEFFLKRQQEVKETREKLGSASKANEFTAKFMSALLQKPTKPKE